MQSWSGFGSSFSCSAVRNKSHWKNAALRQQVLVLKGQVKRPRLRRCDSLFWMKLAYDLGKLEIRSDDCSTGNGDFLAAQTLQTIGGDCRKRKDQDARESVPRSGS